MIKISDALLTDEQFRDLMRIATDVKVTCLKCATIDIVVPSSNIQILHEDAWSYPYIHMCINDDSTFQWTEDDRSFVPADYFCPMCSYA